MSDLFRSDNVVVRSVPASDLSRWVVTFDNYGIGHGFDRPGFGEEFLRNAGISAIHVMGVREDWYQYPEMPAAMQAVRQATAGAERVMTYGSSMGGYAALRFADAAGANAVLAISPQYSIDPKKAPFEKRWLQDSQRIRWLPGIDGRIVCQVRPVVVFDPSKEDGLQIALIQRDIDIVPIRLHHVSHPATTYLGEVGLLKGLVLQTLSGELEADTFALKARRLRRTSGVYVSNLALNQPEHRRELALSLARRSVEVSPGSPLASMALAKLLSRAGRHDEAVEQFERIMDATNRDPNYLVPYTEVLFAGGRHPEALAHAREAVEAMPHLAHLHAWESALLWAGSENTAAVAALERAIALDPHRKRYRKLMRTYRREIRLHAIIRAKSVARRWIVRLARALSRTRTSSAALDQDADRGCGEA
ncbi:tetratricopeptide repeat protein [Brevundimonas naejangsanensis]|uniref:tetratricopeptide repeat protein n=1 Tax=Brevundimonas naejangsanensis TaxID=588932 RepID=UPI001069A32A|nr:tetratricopeptide repeat protein [Brevundimonas naejangsanensis]QBQ49019.1 alpha/beta hydrolase [Brevundimonas naejangsanensis]